MNRNEWQALSGITQEDIWDAQNKRIEELEEEVNSLRRLRDTILSTRYLVDDGYSQLVNIAKSLKEGGGDD